MHKKLCIKYTKYIDTWFVTGLLDKQKAMNIDNKLLKVVTEFNPVLSFCVQRDVWRKVSESFGKSLGN